MMEAHLNIAQESGNRPLILNRSAAYSTSHFYTNASSLMHQLFDLMFGHVSKARVILLSWMIRKRKYWANK
jgi:hypothetical protein